jgi:5-methylcytosine-specific restriction endonuclease McrA
MCGQPARPDDPLEVDHRIPRSKGGRTVRENLSAANRSCNRSRGGREGAPSIATTERTDSLARFRRGKLV